MSDVFIKSRLSIRVDDANESHVTVSLFDNGGKAGILKMTPLGFSTLVTLFEQDADTFRTQPERYRGRTYEYMTEW